MLALHALATDRSAGVRRLGVLLFDSADNWQFLRNELAQALAQLGWVEDRTLHSDWRFADGDAARLRGLAEDLVRDGAQVLMARGTPATRALQQATRNTPNPIPIATGVGDPVGAGFAASLARPGGNITGLSYESVSATRKQIELLRQMVPRLTHLLVLVHASRAPFLEELSAAAERNAREQGLKPMRSVWRDETELRQALVRPRSEGPRAALMFSSLALPPATLARTLLQAGVASVFEHRAFVDNGGLMSWRLDWSDQTQRAAAQLDKLLRGASPAHIPFEQPTRSQFVINAGTAKALGLVIPPALLVLADEVIR